LGAALLLPSTDLRVVPGARSLQPATPNNANAVASRTRIFKDKLRLMRRSIQRKEPASNSKSSRLVIGTPVGCAYSPRALLLITSPSPLPHNPWKATQLGLVVPETSLA